MEEKKVTVRGMNCNHCKINVENGLLKINGIDKVMADIVHGRVIVSGRHINLEQVKSVIEDLGYAYGGTAE